MDVKNRSWGVNTRKPFGLRSNYVQLRSITFDLRNLYRKKYAKIDFFFGFFESHQKFPKKTVFTRNQLKNWGVALLLDTIRAKFVV